MIKTLKRKLSFFFIGTTTFFFTIVMGLMAYILVQSHGNSIHAMNTSILSYIRYDLDESNGELSLTDLQEKYSFSAVKIIEDSDTSMSIRRSQEINIETEAAEPETDVLIEKTTETESNGNIEGIVEEEEQVMISPEYGNIITSYSINDDGSAYVFTDGPDNEATAFTIEFATTEDNTLARNIIIIQLIYVLGVICIVLLCRVFVKTALTPLEETLLRQNEFISSVSHEFRNPLAVIQNSTSLVKSVHGEELGKHVKYLDNITDECTRLSKLLDTMLSYISFNQKTIDIHKDLIKFEDFLIDIYPFLTEKCRTKEIQLDINLPEDYSLPEVEMNKSQMTELFANLVDNAVSFSAEKSKVIINTYIDKKGMYVEVMDNGTGICKSDKELAFEAFYCGDKSRTDKEHFGLGLAVAKDIANNHHAKIKLLDAPGGGCLIQIIFSLV